MRRREISAAGSCLALGLMALVSAPLVGERAAHGLGFDLESFKPAATSTGYLCEESTWTLRPGAVEASVAFGYTHRPLVLRDQVNGGVAGDIVARRSTAYVAAAYGLADRVDVGFRVPFVVAQSGDVAVDWSASGAVPQHPVSPALGDLDVMARVRLAGRLDHPGLRLTLSAPLGLPIGDTDGLVGTGSVSFRPRLIVGWESPRLSVGISGGYEFRQRTEVPGSTFVVGQAIGAGAGIAVLAVPQAIGPFDTVTVLGEVSASVGLEQPESGPPAFPTQVLVGLRGRLQRGFVVQAGAGTGLNQAVGSPRLRALLTVAWTWDHSPGAAPRMRSPERPPSTEPQLVPFPPSTMPVPPAAAPVTPTPMLVRPPTPAPR